MTFTELDLRDALAAEADTTPDAREVWGRLKGRRARQQRVRAGVALGAAAAVGATILLTLPDPGDATVIPPATSAVPTLVPGRPLSAAEMQKAVDSFRQRLDALGVDHTTINAGDDSVQIDASGTTRADIAAIAVQGELQFRSVTSEETRANGAVDYRLGLIGVDNAFIRSANAVQDRQTGDWLVQIAFDQKGARRFQSLTADAAGKPDSAGSCGPPNGCNAIAIVLDGIVLSAPSVQQPGGIKGGETQITGVMTKEQAQTLVALAMSDPLPTEFHLSN